MRLLKPQVVPACIYLTMQIICELLYCIVLYCMKMVNLAIIVIACLCWPAKKHWQSGNFDTFQYLPILTIAPCPTLWRKVTWGKCGAQRLKQGWHFCCSECFSRVSSTHSSKLVSSHIVDQPQPPSCLCPQASGKCCSRESYSRGRLNISFNTAHLPAAPIKLIESSIHKHCQTNFVSLH